MSEDFSYFGMDGPLSGREGTDGVFRDGTLGLLGGGAAFPRRGAGGVLKKEIYRVRYIKIKLKSGKFCSLIK